MKRKPPKIYGKRAKNQSFGSELDVGRKEGRDGGDSPSFLALWL